ncbi:ABC1 kinase family protein [Adlercreutzia aquisgranensis]|uniref:ABC1 kinase family protein n=1 Tax=Adlercreutzia aquisgranensis TaxID=2941323 RepID=UPI0020413D50|nr:AarF/UbiB family protein [Adlercreutzia aquisgranensis]
MATLKEVVQVVREVRGDKDEQVGRRLREIEHIVRKYHVLSGLTPQSATQLLEELGPTFVKLGQIASSRSDVIPPEYAQAFKKLQTDVEPMPFPTMEQTLNAALGHPWQETFDVLVEKPLGSASIAQVHKARIAEHPRGVARKAVGACDSAASPAPAAAAAPVAAASAVAPASASVASSASPAPAPAATSYPAPAASSADAATASAPILSPEAAPPGTWVAVKVRRPQVAEDTLQDLALLRRVVALVGLTHTEQGMKLTLNDLVDELERTTREEIDFCVELRNLERFHSLLFDQPGVESPVPYPQLSTDDVLVMEYVEGPLISEKAAIRAHGWDLAKLGHAIAESYVTQVVDNGFFHADPHGGNIVVRDGKIVWIDLGMVGTLTVSQRALITKAMKAAVENDPFLMMEALLGATRQGSEVDYGALLEKLSLLLAQYMSENLSDINIGQLLTDILEILRKQDLSLPPEYTLLARSMLAIEGVLSDVAPNESIVKIIQTHIQRREFTWASVETKAREFGAAVLSSTESAAHLPTQMSHTLQMLNRGQLKVNADVEVEDRIIAALYSVCGTLGMALISAGLFIGSSMLCWTNMEPKLLGVPLLGALGYIGAFVLGSYVVWRNIKIRHKQKNLEL